MITARRTHTRFFKVAVQYLGEFTKRLYQKFQGRFTVIESYYSSSHKYKYMEILFW